MPIFYTGEQPAHAAQLFVIAAILAVHANQAIALAPLDPRRQDFLNTQAFGQSLHVYIEAGRSENNPRALLLMAAQFGQPGFTHGVCHQVLGKTVRPLLYAAALFAAHESAQHAGLDPSAITPTPESQQI